MPNEKIDKLLDNLTDGLKDDLEIRLDVSNELRSHLEDKIAENQASGLSDDESVAAALKSFGDTIQISDGLIEANISRMKLKARLRKIAGFTLVPAVIVCALISFNPGFEIPALQEALQFSTTPSLFDIKPPKTRVMWFWNKYTPEEKLILYGDKTKKELCDQQKAILNHYPEDKMYLANYIISMLAFNKKDNVARKRLLNEIAKAEMLDPDNAFYNYLAAGIMFEEASTLEIKKTAIKKSKENSKKPEEVYILKIKNRKLMDLAVQEYLKGTRKEYCNSYIFQLLQKRLNIMGKPHSMAESIRQISFAAGTLLPHLNYLRSVSRTGWSYAGKLQDEGNNTQAVKIVNPWKVYLKHITGDANFLIDVLVDAAVASVAEKIIPPIYCKAGMNIQADQANAEMKIITKVYFDWKKQREENKISEDVFAKTSILAAMLLPAIGVKSDYSESDYAVSLKVEYTAVETLAMMLLNGLLLIAMIGSQGTALYWRIRSKQRALLLSPKPALIGKVFILGSALPLICYLLISSLGSIGGHDYNFLLSCTNLVAQFILLLVAIPTIIFILTRKAVIKRCVDLNIPFPIRTHNLFVKILILIALTILIIAALFPVGMIYNRQTVALYNISCGIVLTASLGFIAIFYISKYICTIVETPQYALYYSALTRTLTQVLALAMIFMTVTVIPYLNWHQASLIKQDKIIHGQAGAFTPLESRVTQSLKKKLLEAIGD